MPDAKKLKIVVAGAGSRLVKPFLVRSATDGHQLALVDHPEADLGPLLEELRKVHPTPDVLQTYLVDSANPDDDTANQEIAAAIATMKERWEGDVDSLVITIGAAGTEGGVLKPPMRPGDISIAKFRANVNINLWAPFFWALQVTDWMWDIQHICRVVNFGSISNTDLLSWVLPYGASKAGLAKMLFGLGVHCQEERVRRGFEPLLVNEIVPGFFLAPHNTGLMLDTETGRLNNRGMSIHTRTPLVRFGVPEDLTNALTALATTTTFQNLSQVIIDGGYNGFSGTSFEVPETVISQYAHLLQ